MISSNLKALEGQKGRGQARTQGRERQNSSEAGIQGHHGLCIRFFLRHRRDHQAGSTEHQKVLGCFGEQLMNRMKESPSSYEECPTKGARKSNKTPKKTKPGSLSVSDK